VHLGFLRVRATSIWRRGAPSRFEKPVHSADQSVVGYPVMIVSSPTWMR
jgi:hypothetical protein